MEEVKKDLTTIDDVRSLSKVFYESEIFSDVKSEAQAIVKILAGREVGLSPLESMMGFYIVKGRIAATSKVISSLIKKSEKYDFTIKTLSDTECVLEFTKEGEVIGESSFTFKDAAKAGLANKDNWKNYPRNMLFSRALANGSRWYCPDVFCGYASEEMESVDVEPKAEVVTLEDGEVK